MTVFEIRYYAAGDSGRVELDNAAIGATLGYSDIGDIPRNVICDCEATARAVLKKYTPPRMYAAMELTEVTHEL